MMKSAPYAQAHYILDIILLSMERKCKKNAYFTHILRRMVHPEFSSLYHKNAPASDFSSPGAF